MNTSKKTGILLFLTMAQMGCHYEPDAIPIANKKESLCNLSTIYKLGDRKEISVRENHSSDAKVSATLPEGAIVYVCDDFKEWLNIYFNGTEAACFRTYEGGLKKEEAMKCKSGWIEEKWVNVLSG
jgi:hypothetical protein